MKLTVQDRTSYRITHREYTDEGFLRVPGRVARTGIQEYLARELMLDGDPNRVIRVYRPPEEVFSEDSLASYEGADVTLNHPAGLVTSDNFKQVSAGVVRGRAERDEEYVKSNLIIKDKAAIDAVNRGKCELSAGYTAIYDESPGVTPDGEPYDYVQREIRINHVAIVDRGRAGANARIFDHNPKEPTMHKVMLDSGRAVEVQDEATALLVTDTIERLTKQIKDAEAQAQAAQAKADDATEKLEAAKKASSDEAISARVTAIANTLTACRKFAGDAFTCDSVDPMQIMRAALAVKRPSVDWADKADAYVQAAFDMAIEEPAATTDNAEHLKQLAADAAAATKKEPAKVSAYDAHKARLANAFKGA